MVYILTTTKKKFYNRKGPFGKRKYSLFMRSLFWIAMKTTTHAGFKNIIILLHAKLNFRSIGSLVREQTKKCK